jgi:hypothetical protein
VKRSTTFAKGDGIKVRCYGEHVGELIDKLGECVWKSDENPLGT